MTTNNQAHSEVYQLGQLAWYQGKQIDDCPFPENHAGAAPWSHGWLHIELEHAGVLHRFPDFARHRLYALGVAAAEAIRTRGENPVTTDEPIMRHIWFLGWHSVANRQADARIAATVEMQRRQRELPTLSSIMDEVRQSRSSHPDPNPQQIPRQHLAGLFAQRQQEREDIWMKRLERDMPHICTAGVQAAKDGKGLQDCPYPRGSTEYGAWLQGFQSVPQPTAEELLLRTQASAKRRIKLRKN